MRHAAVARSSAGKRAATISARGFLIVGNQFEVGSPLAGYHAFDGASECQGELEYRGARGGAAHRAVGLGRTS